MHDQKYWTIFNEILAPKMVNLESVSFCNFSNAKDINITDINSSLEFWKFLKILELPNNIETKNINFKACGSLKKIILNGDYHSEKLNCPLMPKWIQVIHECGQ